MKNRYSELSHRRLLAGLSLALPALWLGVGRSAPAGAQDNRPFEPLDLSDRQWREILTPEQYRVLRRDGTEPAFSSPLNKEWRDGTYMCAGCNLALFASAHKYDSGTGWASFWQPINDEHAGTQRDFKLIIPPTDASIESGTYGCLFHGPKIRTNTLETLDRTASAQESRHGCV